MVKLADTINRITVFEYLMNNKANIKFFAIEINLQSRFQQQSGTGLGLSIALEIIKVHEGKLILSNRDVGGLQVKIILYINNS